MSSYSEKLRKAIASGADDAIDSLEKITERRRYKEMEMTRMCGSVPEETINGLKEDLSGFTAACMNEIRALEKTFPKPFEREGYRERYNHIDIKGSMLETATRGFFGAEHIISDIKKLQDDERQTPISDIVPPIILNDLVVRIKKKGSDGKIHQYFDLHHYDSEKELLYYSQYELFNATEEVVKNVSAPVANMMPAAQTRIIPPHLDLTESAIIPLRWVTAMLVTGMHGLWKDMSFMDYPILITWYENEPYKLYRDFYEQENLKGEYDHQVIEQILEASVGFQRYLVKLSEARDKVSIKKERVQKSKDEAAVSTDNTSEKRTAPPKVKHIITLDDDVKIYTNGKDAVKQFRQIQKCPYRYSVRGHYRHYRNGKVVWIKSFDKNKDKPFNPHRYGTEIPTQHAASSI